ncbi:MAG TPA: hypothetical protein VFR23_12400 [Jiangellaceae bacterium]|nr:hypothetical protein [Jiangellaceae bacterium]
MTFDELVASLRQIDGQRDRGKHPPNFHFRSKPFLHFHNSPDRTYTDVRFGGDFDPVTASTPKQREVLLEQVKAHVTAELASRLRQRGQERKDGQNGGYACPWIRSPEGVGHPKRPTGHLPAD